MNVLKIFSSVLVVLVVLTGCSTMPNKTAHHWPLPVQPKIEHTKIMPLKEVDVNLILEANGYYISKNDALNLVNNVDELKAYIQKLEALINNMSQFYGDKLGE